MLIATAIADNGRSPINGNPECIGILRHQVASSAIDLQSAAMDASNRFDQVHASFINQVPDRELKPVGIATACMQAGAV